MKQLYLVREYLSGQHCNLEKALYSCALPRYGVDTCSGNLSFATLWFRHSVRRTPVLILLIDHGVSRVCYGLRCIAATTFVPVGPEFAMVLMVQSATNCPKFQCSFLGHFDFQCVRGSPKLSVNERMNWEEMRHLNIVSQTAARGLGACSRDFHCGGLKICTHLMGHEHRTIDAYCSRIVTALRFAV